MTATSGGRSREQSGGGEGGRCLQEFAFVGLFHLAEVGRFGSLDGPEREEIGQRCRYVLEQQIYVWT